MSDIKRWRPAKGTVVASNLPENAPAFVRAKLGINIKKFGEWLRDGEGRLFEKDGWINFEIKQFDQGYPFVELNVYGLDESRLPPPHKPEYKNAEPTNEDAKEFFSKPSASKPKGFWEN